MSKPSKISYFLLTFIFFIILDFFCTDLFLDNIYNIPENPIFDLVFVQNQGAAFNILNGSKLFLISFSVLAIIGIIFYTLRQINKTSTIALFFVSLLLSGVFTNMFERITYGFVRDYIRLLFIDFPVFNLSDIFINIGVFALVIIIIKNNYSNKKNETDN